MTTPGQPLRGFVFSGAAFPEKLGRQSLVRLISTPPRLDHTFKAKTSAKTLGSVQFPRVVAL